MELLGLAVLNIIACAMITLDIQILVIMDRAFVQVLMDVLTTVMMMHPAV